MSQILKINGKGIFVTATGVKITARGKVRPVSALYAELSKSETRRVRKALRKAGHAQKAAQPRKAG